MGIHNGENRICIENNRMGPRTEPRGTPYKRGEGEDGIPLTGNTLDVVRKVGPKP